ncbi:MAG: rod shape-determining protein MreC [Alphaproteobacteria bacterium]|nr:rod shape-determining protein MreC [Alphaproteobacteria bacterium]
MKRRRSLFLHLNHLRVLVRKFALVSLFLASIVLMVLDKNQSSVLEYSSGVANNAAAPVVSVLVWPAKMISRSYAYLTEWVDIKQDNEKLRQENDELHKLEDKYKSLEIENKLLADLLNYVPLPEAKFVSAKLMTEENGAFAHAMAAYVGDKKVKKGAVVLANNGVVGRVDKKIGNYAKVILLTDISSRIPVVVEKSRVRGVLRGDNTPLPKLVFTPLFAEINVGDRIVTSGVSGVFPAGLPVGYVTAVGKKEIKVKPFASLEKLEYVKIVNYDIGGLLDEAEQ